MCIYIRVEGIACCAKNVSGKWPSATHLPVRGPSAYDEYPCDSANRPCISPHVSISKCDCHKPIRMPIQQPGDVRMASGDCQIGIRLALWTSGWVCRPDDECLQPILICYGPIHLRLICVQPRFMQPDAYFESAVVQVPTGSLSGNHWMPRGHLAVVDRHLDEFLGQQGLPHCSLLPQIIRQQHLDNNAT